MKRWANLGLMGALVSCEIPATQLVLGVDTDLSWGPGGEIESVVVEVRRGGAEGALRDRRITALGTGAGRSPLALWVTVVARDPEDTSSLWIEALGCARADGCTRETAVVSQRASLQFVPREARELRLLLSRSCKGARCALSERCEVANSRCILSDARDEARTLGSSLPRRFGSGIEGSDGGAVRDVTSVSDAEILPDVVVMPDVVDATSDVVPVWRVDGAIDGAVHLDGDSPEVLDGDSFDAVADVSQHDAADSVIRPPFDSGAVDGANVYSDAQTSLMDVFSADRADSIAADLSTDVSDVLDGTCAQGGLLCDAACTDVLGDPQNCGTCGRTCTASPGFIPGCADGRCIQICPAGQQNCGGFCRATGACLSAGSGGCQQTGTLNCVGVNVQCSVGPRVAGECTSPAGGVCNAVGACVCAPGQANCSGACRLLSADRVNCGSCSRTCATDEVCDTGVCVARRAPRPIAPLSLGDVSLRRPMLRWLLPLGIDGAEVQLCRDRACANVIETIAAEGTSARPTRELPARGTVFWRVRGRSAGLPSGDYGPTWQFHVPATSAANGVDVSYGPHFDLNGDGFDDIAVGSWSADPGGRSSAGIVKVFLGSASGITRTPHRLLEGLQRDDQFGYTVENAGDVNGDGFADLVVGARFADPAGRPSGGTASVYLGGPSGLAATPQRVLEGAIGAQLGVALSTAGDVNGDGYADIIAGMPQLTTSGGTQSGLVAVFSGGAVGVSATPIWTFDGPTTQAQVGQSVAGACDLNGDGFGDVIVGAPSENDGSGTARVFLGGTSGLSPTPSATWSTGLRWSRFGEAVAGVGDINRDGYSDAAVWGGDEGGGVRVYLGQSAGVASLPLAVVRGVGSEFGRIISGAGDIDGDGYDDLLVSARLASRGGLTSVGAVFVFQGTATGIRSSSTEIYGSFMGGGFGTAVAGLGDTNGDGYGDFSVGAELSSDGARRSGTAAIFEGGPVGVPVTPVLWLDGATDSENFGASIAGLGR
jgi:hypothetical protein